MPSKISRGAILVAVGCAALLSGLAAVVSADGSALVALGHLAAFGGGAALIRGLTRTSGVRIDDDDRERRRRMMIARLGAIARGETLRVQAQPVAARGAGCSGCGRRFGLLRVGEFCGDCGSVIVSY